MFVSVTRFAAEQTGLFEALGIDWKSLILQAVAFLILVAVLGKYVIPTVIRSIDERQETIERGLKEAQASHQALEDAEAKIEALLADARRDADAIVTRSQSEANSLVSEAETRARERAERIVADARTQLDADIAKARTLLKQDAARLVATATEQIIHEKIDATKDGKLIERAMAAKPSAGSRA